MLSYRTGWAVGGAFGTIVGWTIKWLILLSIIAVSQLIFAITYLVCIPLYLKQGERPHWAAYPMVIASLGGTGYAIYQYHLLHAFLPASQVVIYSALPPYLFGGIISAIFARIAGAMDWLQILRKQK